MVIGKENHVSSTKIELLSRTGELGRPWTPDEIYLSDVLALFGSYFRGEPKTTTGRIPTHWFMINDARRHDDEEVDLYPNRVSDRVRESVRNIGHLFPQTDQLEYRLCYGPFRGIGDSAAVFIHIENLTLHKERAQPCGRAAVALLLCLQARRATIPRDVRVLLAKTVWSTRREDEWDMRQPSKKRQEMECRRSARIQVLNTRSHV